MDYNEWIDYILLCEYIDKKEKEKWEGVDVYVYDNV